MFFVTDEILKADFETQTGMEKSDVKKTIKSHAGLLWHWYLPLTPLNLLSNKIYDANFLNKTQITFWKKVDIKGVNLETARKMGRRKSRDGYTW